MLGDTAYDSDALREDWTSVERGRLFPIVQQKASVQLQQAALQTTPAHRERLQPAQGLQADRNSLRQARAKLSRFRLPRAALVWWI